jgi:hypothetical protein
MHILYVDDSHDEQLIVFSALAIPIDQWHAALKRAANFAAN